MDDTISDEAAVREVQTTKEILGGLTLGEIPIAGSKRRSIAIEVQGDLYKIGRISANKAFVVIRGNLRLLYVSADYKNYKYAARKIFGSNSFKLDIDHALGIKLTKYHHFSYILVTRLDPKTNRSHGWRERPPAAGNYKVNLKKSCYTDDRILGKILGLANGDLPEKARTTGYKLLDSHKRGLTVTDTRMARKAMGMNDECVTLPCLHRISR